MHHPPIIWLPDNFRGPFPSPKLATIEPDGLLAAGGNLEANTLLQAYRQGIFPWYSDDQPILWWSPDPRCVIYPQQLHISKSLRRSLNKKPFEIRQNSAFRQVILACAAPRQLIPKVLADINQADNYNVDNQDAGTWITADMIEAYCELHRLGHAHSIECWQSNELVGGIYGVQLGDVFFGESMFSRIRDASKIALVALFQRLQPSLLDAQVYSPHLASMGAELVERENFLALLKKHC